MGQLRPATVVLLTLALLVYCLGPGATLAAPTAGISLSSDQVRGGQMLALTLTLQIPADGGFVDVYVGFALPGSSSVLVLTPPTNVGGSFNLAAPSDIPPTFILGPGSYSFTRRVLVPPLGVPADLTVTAFVAVLPFGALADNKLDATDVLAVDAKPLHLIPPGYAFEFDATVPSTSRTQVMNFIAEARDTQLSLLGHTVGSVLVFGSNDPSVVAAHYAGWTTFPFANGVEFFQTSGALSSVGVIWLAARGLAGTTDARLVAYHEFFHVLQMELANRGIDVPDDQVPSIGPRWLIEGSAEYMMHRTAADHIGLSFEFARIAERSRAKGTTNALQSMESWTGMVAATTSASYGLGFIAVDYLISVRGAPTTALATFWSSIGTGSTWPEAFQSAFGIAVAPFYTAFEAWRLANL